MAGELKERMGNERFRRFLKEVFNEATEPTNVQLLLPELSFSAAIVALPYASSSDKHPEVKEFLHELIEKKKEKQAANTRSRVAKRTASGSHRSGLQLDKLRKQPKRELTKKDRGSQGVGATSSLATGILKINLAEPLLAKLRGMSKSELAKEIGVSPQKLAAMIDDHWEYITRDAIERVADYLQLTAKEVFEFVPVEFWEPIARSNSCTFLFGSHPEEVVIPNLDSQATGLVTGLLRKFLPGFDRVTFVDHGQDEAELLARATRENCIVIGSSKSNAATEILLSRFFGAEPFNPAVDNRRKIPFCFSWPEASIITSHSSLACSSIAKAKAGYSPGIAFERSTHVTADFMPADNFYDWSTKDGRDCGLVFVANKPFGTSHDVKLIVIAGVSGIGTLAAATALVQDFKYLEPIANESCAYGVIEARYEKRAHSNVRKFRSFHWRYRRGGPWPIRN